MAVAIFTGSMVSRLAHYAIAGTAGNLIVRGATRLRPYAAPAARRATVKVIAAGIVGGRKLGDAAEEARLQAGDLLAEARADLGETAPAPGGAAETVPTEASPKTGPTSVDKVAPRKAPTRKAAPRKRAADDHGHEH